MMTLAAVLCCAMTISMFTACGGDDETPQPQTPGEQQEPTEETTKTPVSVGVKYSVVNRADMLTYLDIVVKCSDGSKVYTSPVLTFENVDTTSKDYRYETQAFFSNLPASFKIWREVKVKEAFQDSVKNLNKFEFSTAIHYYYALYDKDNKKIGSVMEDKHESITYPTHQNNEMVNNYLNKLDINYGRAFELKFDENGKKSQVMHREVEK
jgi:hypothetical protein